MILGSVEGGRMTPLCFQGQFHHLSRGRVKAPPRTGRAGAFFSTGSACSACVRPPPPSRPDGLGLPGALTTTLSDGLQPHGSGYVRCRSLVGETRPGFVGTLLGWVLWSLQRGCAHLARLQHSWWEVSVIFSLQPLWGSHFSTRRRRHITKTHSSTATSPPAM